MPTIRFSSQMYPKEMVSSPAPSITVSHDTVLCGAEAFATFFSSLWHIGNKFFTIAVIEGPVNVTFRGKREVSTGPYSVVRFVGQHLFNDGELLGWVEQDKWQCSRDGNAYDVIVLTD